MKTGKGVGALVELLKPSMNADAFGKLEALHNCVVKLLLGGDDAEEASVEAAALADAVRAMAGSKEGLVSACVDQKW